MSARSELHLIVPGICGPLAETQSLKSHQAVNQWINCLAKTKKVSFANNANSVLNKILGFNIQGDFPSAAFSLLAKELYDSSKSYMCADPVHLQADMDHAILTSSEDLNVSMIEATALCESLNQHFEQDGIKIILLDNQHWFLETNDKIQMTTTELTEAIGRNINFILPDGKDAMTWKKLLTEAQMLMFAHNVNNDRDFRGLQHINSLWFYGTGELPNLNRALNKEYNFCGNYNVLQGIAKHLQCEFKKQPDSAKDYINQLENTANESVNVLYLSDLEHWVNYTDVSIWSEKLTELLNDWLYPLIKMAHNNNIKVTLYPCNTNQYHFSKFDKARFWRRGKLEDYVQCYQRS